MDNFQEISVDLIDPSPYQHRRNVASNLEELAKSIKRDGLIEPIVIRTIKDGRHELIAGERRWRACKLASLPVVLSRVVNVSDIQARRMCAAENMQREDLSPIELIEATVELIDAEMIEDKYYRRFGGTPKIRVSRFLRKRETAERNGYVNSIHNSVDRVDIIFSTLPSPRKWHSFLHHDIPLINLDEDVLDLGSRIKATKAKLKALQKMKKKAPKAYKDFEEKSESEDEEAKVTIPGLFGDEEVEIEDLSARDIDKIAKHEQTLNRRDHYFNSMPEPELPDDKYRILYADPPWKYSDKGLDDYGHAERHYNTMSTDDLCEMGEKIKSLTIGNAVLFMWVTSPLLEDCFKVIRAWGFFYKTSFVWDKVKHNFGHYNSVRHELLLICTRGSCTPDNLKLFDSVQEIERTEKHSEKPEEFRTIIDTLYTEGKKLELFSRKKIDGWDAWGNEI